MVNNYENQCEAWRQRFCGMDQAELCRRLPELEQTDGQLLLWHYGRRLAVDRQTGRISAVSDNLPVSRTEQLNVYTLFGYVQPDARQSGVWVPFRDLRGGAPFAAAFQAGMLTPLAQTFSDKEPLLQKAAARLRGEQISTNGYQLHAFACIPVRMMFWDADEEFSAQANLLFDQNAVDFIHVESMVTIASELLYQMADTASLPIQGGGFARI